MSLAAVGLFGAGMLFSDFSVGETVVDRMITIAMFHIFFGMVLGYLNPRRPWIAALIAWGAVFLGAASLFSDVAEFPWRLIVAVVMIAPLPITLIGAYGGMRLRSITGGLLLAEQAGKKLRDRS